MKTKWFLPLATAAGSGIAFAMRLTQIRTGFEPDTGLPVPDAPLHLLLPATLVFLAALLILLSMGLPKETGAGPALPADFSSSVGLLVLPVAGAFLLGLSGAVDMIRAFGGLWGGSSAPEVTLFLGILSLLSAMSLFCVVAACRRGDEARQVGTYLLAPAGSMVLRLVVAYRVDSVNPTLEFYYIELLALAFLALGFYRLSAFAFGSGRTRRFALYGGLSVIFSVAVLADGRGLAESLLYAGSALTLFGFLLLRVHHIHS